MKKPVSTRTRIEESRVGQFVEGVKVQQYKVIAERQYPRLDYLVLFPTGDVKWYECQKDVLRSLKAWQLTITCANDVSILTIEWRS
jgi:hypothetical protein